MALPWVADAWNCALPSVGAKLSFVPGWIVGFQASKEIIGLSPFFLRPTTRALLSSQSDSLLICKKSLQTTRSNLFYD